MKVFHSILFNSLIVSIANNTAWFALTFWIYLETESVVATSLVGGIYLVVSTMCGFWFGSLVDHYRKKSIMLLSSIFSLGMYIIAIGLFFSTPGSEFTTLVSPILWLFVLLIMLGVIPGNIRSIAVPTLVTHLIPEKERDKANGLSGMLFGVSFMCTSVISGFLLARTGMHGVLLSIIVTTVLSIIHLASVPLKETKVLQTESPKNKVDIIGTLKVIRTVPGLMSLILFATFNNFLGGVYMSLMDAYGLTMVSVEVWGTLWGVISMGFIVGGLYVSRKGIGERPLRALLMVNMITWTLSMVFALQPWIILLTVCMLLSMCFMPIAEAAEQTILQKVVPPERQGRVFGFAQSVEWSAMPLTAFLIGPIAQYFFIPLMSEGGSGARLVGSWFGVGIGRGLAVVFIVAGALGLCITLLAFRSKAYTMLSAQYEEPCFAEATGSQLHSFNE